MDRTLFDKRNCTNLRYKLFSKRFELIKCVNMDLKTLKSPPCDYHQLFREINDIVFELDNNCSKLIK